MRRNIKSNGHKGRSFIETARRAQIVECAIETIADLGYAQASLDRIAQRVGISKGVISYYFAGKDELIHEIVNTVYTTGGDFMISRLKAESTAAGMLRTYIESNVAFMRVHPKHVRALTDIFTNFRTEGGKPCYDLTTNEPVLAGLEKMLQLGQRNGEFREFSTRVMVLAIRAAIDALPPQMTINPELDMDSYSKELVTLFDLATRKRQ